MAEAANELLVKNDRIIIASGTTVLTFAQHITITGHHGDNPFSQGIAHTQLQAQY